MKCVEHLLKFAIHFLGVRSRKFLNCAAIIQVNRRACNRQRYSVALVLVKGPDNRYNPNAFPPLLLNLPKTRNGYR